MIIISYISMLLNDFVVPIMYKHRINTTQAWLKFMPVLFSNFWDFIVYGLFVFVLIIVTVICIIFFGLFTCGIGFLILDLLSCSLLLTHSGHLALNFLNSTVKTLRFSPSLNPLKKILWFKALKTLLLVPQHYLNSVSLNTLAS
jgi:hypothetical protein